jgi:hypothetical protein
MAEVTFRTRRVNARYPFFAEAEATLGDGSSVPAQVSELSCRGCYIDTLQPIPIGTEVRLRISDGMQSCELPGKVIYIHSGYGMGIFGMGVVFGGAPAEELSAVNRWLGDLAQKKRNVPPC